MRRRHSPHRISPPSPSPLLTLSPTCAVRKAGGVGGTGLIRADAEVNSGFRTISAVVAKAATELAAQRPMTPGEAVERLRALYVAADDDDEEDEAEYGGRGATRRGRALDWAQLGRDASVYFREAPSIWGAYHLCVCILD